MFRKKAQTKPFSNLKSSERKKLLRTVCERCGLDETALPAEAKSKIMPKDLRMAKIQLHSGDNALLYSDGEKPVWIGWKDHLVPTLFTLWVCPYVLPYLLTPELTVERLQNGADLMIPGVFDPLPEKAPKGSVVAISTVQNPTVPVAVGVATVDCHTLTDDMTGKAALTVNVVGDTLLEGYRGGYEMPKTLDHTVPREMVEDQVQQLQVEDGDNAPEPGSEKAKDEENEAPAETAGTEEPAQEEYTAQEVDVMFKRALLQTLRKAVDAPFEVPIAGSTFLSQHVIPNLPISDPNINMKKTSYKKAAKFFKAMEKDNLLKFRERNGEIVVQSIAGMENDQVKAHVVYKIKKPASQKQQQGSTKNDKITVKEFFKPRSAAQPLFMAVKVDATVPHPSETLRDVLKQYVDDKKLGQGKQVGLDEVLQKALGVKAAKIDRGEMLTKLQSSCQVSHKVIKPGEPEPRKFAKGPTPSINIVVERRGGNKVVTIVSNLEAFHLNPVNVGEELRVVCAGATSVTAVTEGSDMKEVLVQGPQAKNIIAKLEEKGLRPQWVNVNDKTKKNKNKK